MHISKPLAPCLFPCEEAGECPVGDTDDKDHEESRQDQKEGDIGIVHSVVSAGGSIQTGRLSRQTTIFRPSRRCCSMASRTPAFTASSTASSLHMRLANSSRTCKFNRTPLPLFYSTKPVNESRSPHHAVGLRLISTLTPSYRKSANGLPEAYRYGKGSSSPKHIACE